MNKEISESNKSQTKDDYILSNDDIKQSDILSIPLENNYQLQMKHIRELEFSKQMRQPRRKHRLGFPMSKY
jgi:hypothetical protein